MSEFIAVDGLVLSHSPGSTITGGTFTITSVPEDKTFIDDMGIFVSPLEFTFAGGSAPGVDPGTVATLSPQSIPATAQKTLDRDILVMRVGDSVTMSCQGTSSGAPVSLSGDVEISDAGQDKVEAG